MRSTRILQRLTSPFKQPISKLDNPRFIQTFHKSTQQTPPSSTDSFAMSLALTLSGGLSGWLLRDIVIDRKAQKEAHQKGGRAPRP